MQKILGIIFILAGLLALVVLGLTVKEGPGSNKFVLAAFLAFVLVIMGIILSNL